MNKFLVLIVALALVNVAFCQERRFRAGRAGCNPACLNGGTCTKSKAGSFKCTCLLGLFGAACGKVINFCKTKADGTTQVTAPCGSDIAVSSCAPTATIPVTRAGPAEVGGGPITLAGYACLQNDQIGTCIVAAAAAAPNMFTYTCTTQDNPAYVYSAY